MKTTAYPVKSRQKRAGEFYGACMIMHPDEWLTVWRKTDGVSRISGKYHRLRLK